MIILYLSLNCSYITNCIIDDYIISLLFAVILLIVSLMIILYLSLICSYITNCIIDDYIMSLSYLQLYY